MKPLKSSSFSKLCELVALCLDNSFYGEALGFFKLIPFPFFFFYFTPEKGCWVGEETVLS